MSGTRAASLWRDRGPAQSVFRRPDDALKVQWRPKTGSEHKAHHKTAGARAGQVFREAILGRLDHAPARDQAATVSALPPPLPAQPLATTTPRAPFRPRRRSDRGRLSIRYASCLSLRMALLRARCPQGPTPAARAETFRDQELSAPDTHRNERKVKGSDLSTTQAPDRQPRPTTGSDSALGCMSGYSTEAL